MQQLSPPTAEEKWAVFVCLHDYPVSFIDILAETRMPHVRVIVTLIDLHNDGLALVHADVEGTEVMEWRLCNG